MNLSMALLALSAGFFTVISPCAFLLPAYISFYLRSRLNTKTYPPQIQSKRKMLKEGLNSGIILSSSILFIFTIVGFFIVIIGEIIKPLIPFSQIFVGAVLIIMGITMFLEIEFPFPLKKAPTVETNTGLFYFGILYGIAIVSCSAPIFISLITYTVLTGEIFDVLIIFWLYSLGISLPLIGVSLLITFAKDILINRIAKLIPKMRLIASSSIILVGIYLIYRYVSVVYL